MYVTPIVYVYERTVRKHSDTFLVQSGPLLTKM